ncbi:hypothetical protein B566_EDAN012879, partial [Ephemera danica]
NEEIAGWKVKQTEIDSEQKKVKLEFETKERKVSGLLNQLQVKDREIQVKQSEKRVLQDTINNQLKKSSPAEMKRREEKLQKRVEMEKELEDVQATRVTLECEVERLRSEARHHQTELNKVMSAYTEQQQRIRSRKMELDQAKRQSGSMPPSYGHKMPELLREIERNRRRFSKLPIGPIGLHVKVREQKWALAVESVLISEVRNFFCNTEEDRKVLMEIWKRVMPSNIFVTVVVSPFQERAVSQDQFISFMDMLVVENPIVMNYLIDQKNIEQVLLCDNLNYTMDRMADVNRVPRHCSFVVTQEAETIHPAPLYRYYNSDIRNDEARLVEFKEEARDPEKETARVKTELNQTTTQLRRVEEKYNQLKNAIRELDAALDELKSKETVYRSHCTDMKPREIQMTNEVSHQERMVEDAEKVASDACDRIETRHSFQSLQQKIASEKQFVATMSNKLQDDPEVIREKVQQLAAKSKQIKEMIHPISDVLEHFTVSLEDRKHRYHNAMRCLMKSIENTFAGKLIFNHQSREMLVSLNVKGKRNEKLKNLSGGERSYTTISLILSVWDKLRIPFFMLDEFDVFMDMVNRRICSDMLVAEALSSQGRCPILATTKDKTGGQEVAYDLRQLSYECKCQKFLLRCLLRNFSQIQLYHLQRSIRVTNSCDFLISMSIQ